MEPCPMICVLEFVETYKVYRTYLHIFTCDKLQSVIRAQLQYFHMCPLTSKIHVPTTRNIDRVIWKHEIATLWHHTYFSAYLFDYVICMRIVDLISIMYICCVHFIFLYFIHEIVLEAIETFVMIVLSGRVCLHLEQNVVETRFSKNGLAFNGSSQTIFVLLLCLVAYFMNPCDATMEARWGQIRAPSPWMLGECNVHVELVPPVCMD